MTLEQDIDQVHTQQDLAVFMNKLLDDYLSNSDDWENSDLESYLSAIAAWIADLDGYYKNMNLQKPNDEAWQTVARVLLAARIYE